MDTGKFGFVEVVCNVLFVDCVRSVAQPCEAPDKVSTVH